MPLVGFAPAASAGERPHTQVLDHVVTGTGCLMHRPIAAFMHLSNHIIETECLKRLRPLPFALQFVAHSNAASQHCEVYVNEKASFLLCILESNL